MKIPSPLEPTQVSKEEESKWISVEERLPELAGNYLSILVLCYSPFTGFSTLFYDYQLNNFTNKYGTVTHWMLLPEPPNTK